MDIFSPCIRDGEEWRALRCITRILSHVGAHAKARQDVHASQQKQDKPHSLLPSPFQTHPFHKHPLAEKALHDKVSVLKPQMTGFWDPRISFSVSLDAQALHLPIDWNEGISAASAAAIRENLAGSQTVWHPFTGCSSIVE